MRKMFAVAAVVLLAVSPVQADQVGSFFGSLTTAQSLPAGHTALGIQVGLADSKSYVGSFSVGMPAGFELRAKGGMVDLDLLDNEWAFGGELKWHMWKAYSTDVQGNLSKNSFPVDVAMGPAVEWFSVGFGTNTLIESQSVIQAGWQFLASMPFEFQGGGSIAPYGQFNIRQEFILATTGPSWPANIDPDFNQTAYGFHGGLAWYPKAAPLALFAEYQLDGNDGFFGGVQYQF